MICFKGGTSLSKVYHCIDRFSEDIDLTLHWSALELRKEDAYSDRSNTKQDVFNHMANKKTEKLLKEVWLPLLKKDFTNMLGNDFDLYVDEVNPQTINFKYPQAFKNDG